MSKKPALIITGLLLVGVAVLALLQQKTHARPPACESIKAPFPHYVCTFNPSEQTLSLVWQGQDGKPLLSFDNLLKAHNNVLFAVNAGMYNADYAPIGYTVIDGTERLSLNLKTGGGNFHLLPNGVFWWDASGYHISESQQMAALLKAGTQPLFATQSGPMLVIDGQIHPKFDPDSDSAKLRNGVGVCADGRVRFVNSAVPVNFYNFANLFKETLHCDNALFLDGGSASALYSRELARHDKKQMGVMAVVTDKPKRAN